MYWSALGRRRSVSLLIRGSCGEVVSARGDYHRGGRTRHFTRRPSAQTKSELAIVIAQCTTSANSRPLLAIGAGTRSREFVDHIGNDASNGQHGDGHRASRRVQATGPQCGIGHAEAVDQCGQKAQPVHAWRIGA